MPTIMVNVTKTNYDTAMLVGARPNFVKVAPLLSKFEENNQSKQQQYTNNYKKSMDGCEKILSNFLNGLF